MDQKKYSGTQREAYGIVIQEKLGPKVILKNTHFMGAPPYIKSSRSATMYSQGGKSTITKKGMLGTLESYLYVEGIANILSLYQLAKKYRITFDSANGNCFIVDKGPSEKVVFKSSKEGLYYHDMKGSNKV